MDIRKLELLGEPDLTIAGLRVWIHGRQFPDSSDYWDANWLQVTACCVYPTSAVTTQGPIIHLGEVLDFQQSCQKMYDTLSGKAELTRTELELLVSMEAGAGGHISLEIAITPNTVFEEHIYRDSIDQSYLPPILDASKSILNAYPVIGTRG